MLKEFHREWRMKTGILGILLHIIAAIYISYLSFQRVPEMAKNPLFWIIMLFTTINGISRGFMEEKRGYKIYLQQMVRPEAIILSKLIYHALLMIFLTLATYLVYVFFIELQPLSHFNYIVSILLSVIGISAVFTMVSAMAANASKPGLLIPVMSLPMVLPIILVGMKAADRAMKLSYSDKIYTDWMLLLLLNLLIGFLSVILFKFLRQE